MFENFIRYPLYCQGKRVPKQQKSLNLPKISAKSGKESEILSKILSRLVYPSIRNGAREHHVL